MEAEEDRGGGAGGVQEESPQWRLPAHVAGRRLGRHPQTSPLQMSHNHCWAEAPISLSNISLATEECVLLPQYDDRVLLLRYRHRVLLP